MEEDALIIKNHKLRRKSKKSNQRIISLLFILSMFAVSLSINFTVGCRRSYLTIDQDFAHWVKVQGQEYLFLRADNEYELGKLEGKWLSVKITNLKRILQLFGFLNNKYGFGYSDMIEMAKKYEFYIPNEYKQEFQGIDDAILGITYDDILLQNCFVDILYGSYFTMPDLNSESSNLELGCTVVGFLGNGTSQVGQNFDFNNIFKHSMAFVFHKISGKQAQFSLKIGGILSLPCGINSANTSAFINVVRSNVKAAYGEPLSVRIRRAFDMGKNPDDFLSIITKNSSTLSMNLLFSNDSSMISVQAIPNNLSISRPTYCVNTNTYTDPFFQQYLQDEEYSKSRQETAENLLESYTEDMDFTQLEFISLMSNSEIYKSESGLMGISTLVCLSTSFFCRGVSSQGELYPSIPQLS
jgi:hypothetical protein